MLFPDIDNGTLIGILVVVPNLGLVVCASPKVRLQAGAEAHINLTEVALQQDGSAEADAADGRRQIVVAVQHVGCPLVDADVLGVIEQEDVLRRTYLLHHEVDAGFDSELVRKTVGKVHSINEHFRRAPRLEVVGRYDREAEAKVGDDVEAELVVGATIDNGIVIF